jgi:hypothetical protein
MTSGGICNLPMGNWPSSLLHYLCSYNNLVLQRALSYV